MRAVGAMDRIISWLKNSLTALSHGGPFTGIGHVVDCHHETVMHKIQRQR